MKKVLLFLLLTLLGFTFFSLTPIKAEAASDSVVRIWLSQYTQENDAMIAIANQFTNETGIAVEVVPRINAFNGADDLVNNAELDDRPDIVLMQAPDIGGLIASGYLEPLTDFIDDEMTARYADVAFSAFSYNGNIYGVGYSIDTYGLLYNKDLIAEEDLPETWEEYFALGEALTIRNDDGEVTQWGILMNSRDMWFNYPIIKEFGGYYYGQFPNGDYNPFDIGLDNEGMVNYIAKVKELKENGLVLTNKIHGESEIVSRFANGNVAMMIYGLWYASIFKQKNVNYGIASLPDQTDGTTSLALTTVQGFVVNKFTDNLEESLQFLEYILEDDNQQLLIEGGNNNADKIGTRNPTNYAVINSEYIQSDEVLASLGSLNGECEPFPNIPEGTIWYNYTSTVFQSIFFSDSDDDDIDVQAKLSELTEAIRNDVALMNYQAERIDIPSWIWAVIIGVFVIGIAAYLIIKKYVIRKKKPHYGRISWKETLIAWLLMVPLLILLIVFYVYPIIHNVYLSLTDYSGINLRDYGLIGFANYKDIFVAGLDGLASMTVWTIVFATCVVTLSFLLGTILASVLNKINFHVAKFYRIIFILPWVIPTVITLLMWQGLLDTDNGLVNQILGLVGIPNIPWLSDPYMAKISTILVMVWFSFPYFMIIATGHLKAIPKDYYEAAKVDGASAFHIFFTITLPLVFRALIPILIMSFIMQFNQFGVYILTQGGPAADTIGAPGATDLLITYVFNTAFNTNRFAVAAAYSVIIFVFVAIFSLIAMRVGRKISED
ncbi:MAG: extracellular solute-binding protein [Candidatus Izemoplasmatales bacterium]|jgi:arabinogalactan oligomer/maltooligosaccharide transport system permease protein|nr:extracellular solute-binding protein [Candidatus Izemoplasmatales bacterium]